MKIAVITGASSGIGREFVYELDRRERYDELWLIARRVDRLMEFAGKTRARVRAISLDLCQKESFEKYKALLRKYNPAVKTLVNASGFGRFGAFEQLSEEDQLAMIDLNDKALVSITYLTLPYMRRGSRIYQIGSLSSFQPVPYIGVYGASKAFVLSFSRSLNVELKSKGIRVMAVCPGWVRTEFFNRAVSDDTITYYNKFFDPDEVVKRAISDMEKGKDVSVCGLSIRAQVLLTKLMPHKAVMKIWCLQQKK